MDSTQYIVLTLLFVSSCFCWYRIGIVHGGTKIVKKLEKDIKYVESLMRSAEMKKEYDNGL